MINFIVFVAAEEDKKYAQGLFEPTPYVRFFYCTPTDPLPYPFHGIHQTESVYNHLDIDAIIKQMRQQCA